MGFDASRGHEPWPGWQRLLDWLPPWDAFQESGRKFLSVLDVGCGNARLATFLTRAGYPLRYVGVDSSRGLLEAARERLELASSTTVELIEADFLSSGSPGDALPKGPFDFVALFGVLHHVPGSDWRATLLRSLARRVATNGILAIAAWQFAGRPRFTRRRVEWRDLGPVLGKPIDEMKLEPGDALLRFGSDPTLPPRYCHQVAADEFDGIPKDLDSAGIAVQVVGEYNADGADGDLNRYLILRRPD